MLNKRNRPFLHFTFVFAFFLVASCAQLKEKTESLLESEKRIESSEFISSILSEIDPQWYRKFPDKLILPSEDKEKSIHFFFDVFPNLRKDEKIVNFIALNPQSDAFHYGLDTASGKFYLEYPYCSEKDPTREYEDSLSKKSFTLGFVPRVLDQLNSPLKILVFGNGEYYQKYFKTNFFEARVIGAIIEEYCPSGDCFKPQMWLKRLVLVGVQRDHPDYLSVKNLTELKEIVNWQKVKAELRTLQGSNLVGEIAFPAYRHSSEVDASESLEFLSSQAYFFTQEKLDSMRRSCIDLYDYFETQLYRPFVNSSEKSKQSFTTRFKLSFFKFHKQYKTCLRFVRKNYLRDSQELHSFFVYVDAYFHLHQLGYYYSCPKKSWRPIPAASQSKEAEQFDLQDQFYGCEDSNFLNAFALGKLYLDSLIQARLYSYRYIQDDSRAGGTHFSLHNWVKHNNQHLTCHSDGSGSYFKTKQQTGKIQYLEWPIKGDVK